MTAAISIDSWDVVLGFSRMMIAAGEFIGEREVQDYYERPDKWAVEQQAWVDAGSPREGEDGWELWTKRLEKMLNGEGA